MKLCILGDTHHGMRGDSLDFHRYYKKFYDTVFFPYLEENGIKVVLQLGDLFDRRKFINFNSLYLVRKYFFDKLKDMNIDFYTLLGNHDVSYKNTLEINSSTLLLKEYENIHIIDEPCTKTFDDLPIDFVPWICDDNEQEVLDYIKNSFSQICVGHFEIDGFEMDRGSVFNGGMNRNKLLSYDIVLTGHFHHKSNQGNIHYVGTPGEMTWSDYNDTRGFHIFDTDTRDLTFIENPYKMFHKIFYDDSVNDFEYWKKFDYSYYQGTYVKIVVVKKDNPYLFDSVVDNFYKTNICDISIVEDFSEHDNEDDIVDQAEDTMTILSKYIDNLPLKIESEKLKRMMKEIYIEALDSQNSE
jgi:DNA repair exonuclease SbcCD nuclease subunit